MLCYNLDSIIIPPSSYWSREWVREVTDFRKLPSLDLNLEFLCFEGIGEGKCLELDSITVFFWITKLLISSTYQVKLYSSSTIENIYINYWWTLKTMVAYYFPFKFSFINKWMNFLFHLHPLESKVQMSPSGEVMLLAIHNFIQKLDHQQSSL